MPLELQIDRSSEVPVYRQVIERIASLVRAGGLKPGDRLPPERELSAQLGIARGTITRAYEELARNGLIEVTSGRGSFVSAQQDVIPVGRKERAIELINAAVKQLIELRFSYREIKSMVDLVVLEREEQLESLTIAVVDCSPEALSILYRQLGILSRISSKTILLDDLAAGAEPQKRLAGFSLRQRLTLREQFRYRWAPLFAGVCLLAFLGAGGEHVDVLGHALGFMAGIALGWVYARARLPRSRGNGLQAAAGVLTLALIVLAWLCALRHPAAL